MLYRFRVNVVIRIVILVLLLAGGVASYDGTIDLPVVLAFLLTIVMVFNLFYYVDQTNRDLVNFLTSIKFNDYTTTSSAAHRGRSFGQLYDGFNLINRKFQEVRAEKEANHQFLQTVVEHINIGLLCYDEDEEIVLMNKALQGLLHKSYLINLEGLRTVDEKLFATVRDLPSGERTLTKLIIDNKLLQVAIQSTELVLNKSRLKLVSFQNIQSELEGQELMAWQKLIRILTHEIMNSVAPIASLSSTLKDIIGEKSELDQDALKMVRHSLGVIQKRSQGLMAFTDTYRELTRIPPPKFQLVDGKELLEEAETLFRARIEAENINFQLHTPPSEVQFQGDPNLLEQVLINLIKNAMDALEGQADKVINVHLQKSTNGKVSFQVADNGPGIPAEKLDQIFIPFYTTKETGSGIGLSLSRQIMRLHKGSLEVQTVDGQGSIFTMTI
ncbi:sensor histidine kinase [Flavilitoribacter nigricans]|uniref:histidine kinase n=1 Tax=Flavilitoribacter nigricans (strain ATCC 23147 / DSM 23189 / NBRC 102662 / NCIMB 1420 / SS-2) TaxID=1122177 RepID=A0A2D0NIU3_FLAN2|nr:ATP-binding protein [Flavilitoribacter nigricans]PHN07673.1 ATP-binding protein [Flavilitoribacter nigricans DSM 23189 = NBRC 102662]